MLNEFLRVYVALSSHSRTDGLCKRLTSTSSESTWSGQWNVYTFMMKKNIESLRKIFLRRRSSVKSFLPLRMGPIKLNFQFPIFGFFDDEKIEWYPAKNIFEKNSVWKIVSTTSFMSNPSQWIFGIFGGSTWIFAMLCDIWKKLLHGSHQSTNPHFRNGTSRSNDSYWMHTFVIVDRGQLRFPKSGCAPTRASKFWQKRDSRCQPNPCAKLCRNCRPAEWQADALCGLPFF